MKDVINLPPLPKGDIAADTCPVMWAHTDQQIENYAREAIKADRQQREEQQPTPDVAALVEALERFVEAWTDCQQQPVHAEEFEILTDICEDSLKALAAHHKQRERERYP